MEHNIEVLARQLLNIDEQIEALAARRADIVTTLTDAVEVGGAVEVDGHAAYRVSQRRTFDVERARQIVPPEVIAQATVPTLDTKALKNLIPPALIDACMKPGAIYVTRAKA